MASRGPYENTGNVRMVVIFGMGVSIGSIWTHNRPRFVHNSVGNAQYTVNFHYQDPGNEHSHKESKGPCVASSGDRKTSRDRVPTARVCRGGSRAKLQEVGGPIYAEIWYI